MQEITRIIFFTTFEFFCLNFLYLIFENFCECVGWLGSNRGSQCGPLTPNFSLILQIQLSPPPAPSLSISPLSPLFYLKHLTLSHQPPPPPLSSPTSRNSIQEKFPHINNSPLASLPFLQWISPPPFFSPHSLSFIQHRMSKREASELTVISNMHTYLLRTDESTQ